MADWLKDIQSIGRGMKRNRYRLVRRSDKWVVRAEHRDWMPNYDWIDRTRAYKVMGCLSSNRVDYWFHTRGEAIMFLLSCT